MELDKTPPQKKSSKPIARGQSKQAVDTLGRRIASGDYKEGETLPIEAELSEMLGIGRNALREAVKILSAKGFLTTAPRSGTKVRSKIYWNMLDQQVLSWHADPAIATESFMLDLIEIRQIIEPKAAKLAAERATREDISNIMSAFESMKEHKDDLEKRLEADIEFHSLILMASHNTILSQFKTAVATYLKAHVNLGKEQTTEEINLDLQHHQELAWAIASGQADKAYSIVKDILVQNTSHLPPTK
ncbi:FadR/GntR family transcriptional regulator [Aliiglaciecola sp. 2_MG-2023]|uniref:FadR/GntR family transcriptional regulator n=1 Tax=unclassified Aliiglaciecola TaxID=2593648 RepID=UPI0026E1EAD8|nr:MULTISPECIES: FadR/GntR family transcriptional regulator [unclassified Aliiglaciecola]MDO6710640.1 FadR/GntR family transcriptional regulator [Aliiglaciecola sp. 2_MG-2023]MDO6754273.1 FadR/GntR family transcriptional regulator [Aliiglaciecola sp. 1_MG-2023]